MEARRQRHTRTARTGGGTRLRVGAVTAVLCVGALAVPADAAVKDPHERPPAGDYDMEPEDPEPKPVPEVVDAELVSFTAQPLSVQAGETSTLRWSVRVGRDVKVFLDDREVPPEGAAEVIPRVRDEEHRLFAGPGRATKYLGAVVIGVNPCPPRQKGTPSASRPPSQCSRRGRAAFDYTVPAPDWKPYVYSDDPDPEAQAETLLNPPSHVVRLNACATDPGRGGRIERYEWRLVPAFGRPDPTPMGGHKVASQTCQTWTAVSELGKYRAEMAAHTAAGTVLSASKTVDVRELLVVSLGDSMASGEGNPDTKGNYYDWDGAGKKDAIWKHDLCHRSAKSGHKTAADRIEANDERTKVAFISLACSGATIANLTHEPQTTREVFGEVWASQPPQLENLRDLLCRHDACRRPIDALILSIGVNDLGFSGILSECFWESVHPTAGDCSHALDKAETNVEQIDERLLTIRQRLSELGLVVRQVLITEYPVNILTGADGRPREGCGAIKLSQGESARFLGIGNRLNDRIRFIASHSEGWKYVAGIVDEFQGHGYCEPDRVTYFQSWAGSKDTQGDDRGTAHPDIKGHNRLAKVIAGAFRISNRPPLQAERG